MEPTDLLQSYRDFMARTDIAAKPERIFERGFYVPRIRFSMKEIATRLLLEPNSTHLLVGGIGSGKTTELIQGCGLINSNKDSQAIYIDVSVEQQLDQLKPGVLLTLVGLRLADKLGTGSHGLNPAFQAARSIRAIANGFWDQYEPDGPDYDDLVYTPGIIIPPGPMDPVVRRQKGLLETLLTEVRKQIPYFIVFFDSLDRIRDPAKLAEIVLEDIAALKQLGIGVMLVGPLHILYGSARSIVQHFDHYSLLPDIEVSNVEQGGRNFLQEVLRRRAEEQMLPDETCSALVQMSGGILRDLLRLAKQAGQRAFMEDAPHITPTHVQAVAELEGRKLLFGVTETALIKLKALARGERFVLATEEDVTLLETRRVIQYQDDAGQTRYVLHPVMQSLLAPTPPSQTMPRLAKLSPS
ncbi:hypothetical protein [Haliangium sp. UPWRP_2]|uniref:hypothetical protein n=1 Tax=Haliangium sp. UPWRP_2 TaxID=1931276 RepID=UPI001304A4EB|nr:hypothetical protein [Haliangium sp. UPWRP_2]PSM31822.1 hypothetical protein BVG81_003450 [Haliangium sp. UPWRP_2]